MKPPKCEICKKNFRPIHGKSGGIHFRLTDEEKAYNQKMRDEKKVGHPRGYGWFCEEHYKAAKEMKGECLVDVIRELATKRNN